MCLIVKSIVLGSTRTQDNKLNQSAVEFKF